MVRRGRASTRSLATSRTAHGMLALSDVEARRGMLLGRERTGCVSELILLALYPVLERLRVASGELNLLLDSFLVHIGHATLLLPEGEVAVARGAKWRGRLIQGPYERGSRDTGEKAGGAVDR
jgi:hypothetical protein